jgi:hypothetical protein
MLVYVDTSTLSVATKTKPPPVSSMMKYWLPSGAAPAPLPPWAVLESPMTPTSSPSHRPVSAPVSASAVAV